MPPFQNKYAGRVHRVLEFALEISGCGGNVRREPKFPDDTRRDLIIAYVL